MVGNEAGLRRVFEDVNLEIMRRERIMICLALRIGRIFL